MITQKELIKYYNYNEESGIFTIKAKRKNLISNVGDVIGTVNKSGYLVLSYKGKVYLLHRLAWLYIHGEFPDVIDHINQSRTDNRLANLRNVTQAENNKNWSKQRHSGKHFGVNWFKKTSKWRAHIKVDGKQIHLGYFHKYSEAVDARKLAEVAYGFHENHGKDL